MAFTLSDITGSYELSRDCTVKIGSVLLGGLKNASVSYSFDEGAENSTLSDGAWKSSAPGRGSCSLSVTFNKLTDDICQVGLRNWAVLADRLQKTAEIVFRTENNTTSKGTGWKGQFYLTSLSEEVADDPSQAIECSAEFVSFGSVVADNYTSGSGGSGESGGVT